MKSQDFCYWLQGIIDTNMELNGVKTTAIRNKLKQVFIEDIDKTFPEHQQAALHAAHQGQQPSELGRC